MRAVAHQHSSVRRSTLHWCLHKLFFAMKQLKHFSNDVLGRRATMSGALLTWVRARLDSHLSYWRQLTHQASVCEGVMSKWKETSASIPPVSSPPDSDKPA